MLSQGIYTLFYMYQVWGESELHFERVELKVPMRYSGRDSSCQVGVEGWSSDMLLSHQYTMGGSSKGAARSHRERLPGGTSQTVALGSPASKPHTGLLKMPIPQAEPQAH